MWSAANRATRGGAPALMPVRARPHPQSLRHRSTPWAQLHEVSSNRDSKAGGCSVEMRRSSLALQTRPPDLGDRRQRHVPGLGGVGLASVARWTSCAYHSPGRSRAGRPTGSPQSRRSRRRSLEKSSVVEEDTERSAVGSAPEGGPTRIDPIVDFLPRLGADPADTPGLVGSQDRELHSASAKL